MPRPLLLLSGGIDSTAIGWWKRPPIGLVIDYGQRSAAGEIQAATQVATLAGMRLDVLSIDCTSLGSGDLAGTAPLKVAPVSEWWPFRNQLLATMAAARALELGCDRIWLGCVASDDAHADGTETFIEHLNRLTQLQEGHIKVEAPALGLSSIQLVQQSRIPRSVLSWSHSCHTSPFACGSCRGCAKHREVFEGVYGASEAY